VEKYPTPVFSKPELNNEETTGKAAAENRIVVITVNFRFLFFFDINFWI